MKILCIADSLALPGHDNTYEDTWFYKLQVSFREHSFISFFKRSITTEILVTEGGGDASQPITGADCLEFYMPDLVILQLGIVDCAPRLMRRKGLLYKIIQKSPAGIQNAFYKGLKKVRKRSSTNADVPPNEFLSNLDNYLSRCVNINVKKVIIIKICTPDDSFVQKSPDILDAVKLYNSIIDKLDEKYSIVTVVDPLASNTKHIFEDGYHPNPEGNDLVFNALQMEISNV
ncbi:MAG: SGNH/GDSL hydrolase family protein [Mucilaginibacter sp.]